MKKLSYQSPDVILLNLLPCSFIAVSGKTGAGINEVEEGEELPWIY